MRFLRTSIVFVLAIPLFVAIILSDKKSIMRADLKRWKEVMGIGAGEFSSFLHLITFYPEFRTLVYLRLGKIGKWLTLILPRQIHLIIHSDEIGPGLFIQHGFSTMVSCDSIGKNCWINQQVSVGYSSKTGRPTLKDNVTILAGAKVIGPITVGNNSIVGANAVVLKDVPDNCVVVGIPAYIIKKDGQRVKIPL